MLGAHDANDRATDEGAVKSAGTVSKRIQKGKDKQEAGSQRGKQKASQGNAQTPTENQKAGRDAHGSNPAATGEVVPN